MKNTNDDWILTFTGRKMYPTNPTVSAKDSIHIVDIAHALSNICRFTGHTRFFYSVAQHSVHVAARIFEKTGDNIFALAGLLHDASEAYLCDLARPVKNSDGLYFYRRCEKILQSLIFDKYGIRPHGEIVEIIKEADENMLGVEAYFLMPKHPEFEQTNQKPAEMEKFLTFTPDKAKTLFMNAFFAYGGKDDFKNSIEHF